MNSGAKNKLVIISLAICVVVILALFIQYPLSETKGVHIVSSVEVGIGAADNDTEMDLVAVHGILSNDGDASAKNSTITVIFTDTAHNAVVRKTVKEGIELLPGDTIEFDSEYSRKRVIPKTIVDVTVQFDWIENGQLKTMIIPRSEENK